MEYSTCDVPRSVTIQKKFVNHLIRRKHDFVIQNIYLFDKESDILSVKDSIIYEYEVKICSSDFAKDIRKGRHKESAPHFFYYIIWDESIINGSYLPYAGFIVCELDKTGFFRFKYIKEAECIREYPLTFNESYSLLKKMFNKLNG